MPFIRKRTLPSGKTRWQVVWDTAELQTDDGLIRRRGTAMFDSHTEAKAKLAAVLRERPKSMAAFTALTQNFVDYYEHLVEVGEREQSSLRQLRQHIDLHILPDAEFSGLKCGHIDTVVIQLFLDRLSRRVSPKMATKVRGTLSRVFNHGARRGFVSSNPVTASKIERRKRPDAGQDLQFYLPPRADLKKLLDTAKRHDNTGRAEATIRMLMFAGLRISEFRGLWLESCDFGSPVPFVKIVRRADQFGVMGSVKSAASLRKIEIGQQTAAAVRAWLPARPDNTSLVFPSNAGTIWDYHNFWNRFWVPLMNETGLVTKKPASKTIRQATKANEAFKQPAFGPHTLRHVYASLQIAQNVSPKRLQKLMGHSTLKLTLDTYGHLWPDETEDRERARNVELTL